MQNYYRRNPLSNLLGSSVTTTIVIVNVMVFIMQMLLVRTPFLHIFAMIPRFVIFRGFIWQLVTYMFLHGDIWHLFFNMLIIWMFGSTLEQVWGQKRFLQYYFLCGLGGAVFSFIFSFNSLVIGASGAGFGILLAYGVTFLVEAGVGLLETLIVAVVVARRRDARAPAAAGVEAR